jgi:hypothetical protein
MLGLLSSLLLGATPIAWSEARWHDASDLAKGFLTYETRLAEALNAGDTPELDLLLAHEFISTAGDGAVEGISREVFLERIYRGEEPKLEVSDVAVRCLIIPRGTQGNNSSACWVAAVTVSGLVGRSESGAGSRVQFLDLWVARGSSQVLTSRTEVALRRDRAVPRR